MIKIGVIVVWIGLIILGLYENKKVAIDFCKKKVNVKGNEID